MYPLTLDVAYLFDPGMRNLRCIRETPGGDRVNFHPANLIGLEVPSASRAAKRSVVRLNHVLAAHVLRKFDRRAESPEGCIPPSVRTECRREFAPWNRSRSPSRTSNSCLAAGVIFDQT
jgi:hypothetical protein